jgi:damage-control phosphatase, subfamily I
LQKAMNTQALCLPCLAVQAHRILEMVGADEATIAETLRLVLGYLAEADYDQPSPIHTGRFCEMVSAATGVADPFGPAKRSATELALRLLPDLEARVNAAADSFDAALRIAIAGNVIDLATRDEVPVEELLGTLEETLACELDAGAIAELREHVGRAKRILFLADNAGEIVFDQPLLRLLPLERVTVAVRGGPILNDATMDDARASGLTEFVRVVDNGAAIPGTWPPACSAEFRQIYGGADLIISKGQGNFETLFGRTTVPTWFLFRVKCRGIEVRTGRPVGTNLVLGG